MRRIPSLILLVLLASTVLADGGVYTAYSYGEDTLSLMPEDVQYAYIEHGGGVEELRVAVKTRFDGEQMFWILPLPARAEDVEVDVLEGFPEFSGHEVNSRAGYIIHQSRGILLATQLYTIPFSPLMYGFSPCGVFSMGGGRGDGVSAASDSGVRVEAHMEKKGLTLEALKADDWSSLDNYLQMKGVKLPDSSRDVIGEYVGGGYSFMVAWVSDAGEYARHSSDTLSMKARFPSKKIFYPMKLTSVYGEQRVPIRVYVKGFVQPEPSSSREYSLHTGYYGGDTPYTKISVNARARDLNEDLWLNSEKSLKTTAAYAIGRNTILAPATIFLYASCIAALIAGYVVHGRRHPLTSYMKIGIYNFATVLGVYHAADNLETEKHFGIDTVLLWVLGGLPAITVVAAVAPKAVTALLFAVFTGVSLRQYLKSKSFPWMMLTATYALLYLEEFIPKAFDSSALLTIFYAMLVPLLYMTSILYLLFAAAYFIIVSFPLQTAVALLALLVYFRKDILSWWGRITSAKRFTLVFTVYFTLLVLLTTQALLSVYQPDIYRGGTLVSHGFNRIKPQLAGTGIRGGEGVFMAMFTNGVGRNIDVTGVLVEGDDVICEGYSEPTRVGAGDNFRVTAHDCVKGTPGDLYSVTVTLDYEVDGENYYEEGFIRGPFE